MRHRRSFLLLLGFAVLATLGYWVVANIRTRAAYESICTVSSSLEAGEKVYDLARRAGQTEEFLLAVALGDENVPCSYVEAREAAVLALGDRTSFERAEELARLLQPHVAPVLWQATAKALGRKVCTFECTRRVLHFLERLLVDDHYEKQIRSPLYLQEHAAMKRDLIQVLAKNKSALFPVLVETYGLGTPRPAPVAVWVIEQADMVEACSSLNEAIRLPLLDTPKLEVVRKVAASLKCEAPEPLHMQIR